MRANAAIVLLFVILCPVVICGQTPASDSLNKGIQAMESAKFEEAVVQFKKAIELDPELTIAELHLGMAYMQQVIPFLESAENLKLADLSIQSFQKYLRKVPKSMDALVGVATVYQNTLQFDKAREAYIRCAEVEPQNHLPYYAVGTLDWLLVHNWGSRFTADEKSKFLEEGMRYLDKAFALKPDYEDTFWYQNLLLREKVILLEDRIKATTDKPTQNSLRAEVEVLKARADERVSSALETRRKNAAKTATPASRGRD